jgi:hypothetical protein
LAQMLGEVELNARDRASAVKLLKGNLSTSKDWIVINMTLESLAKFAREDARLRRWLLPVMRQYQGSDYKSIAIRARRLCAKLEK